MLNKAAKLLRRFDTLLIVLLIISAMYLLFRATSDEPARFISDLFYASSDHITSGPSYSASVAPSLPYTIVLTDENGNHSAVKYDAETKSRVFSLFSAVLGEAMGSAGQPFSISDDDWFKALGEQGVYIEYLYPLPLGVFADHLGSNVPESQADIYVRRLLLGDRNGNLYLYYRNENSGDCLCMGTPLSFESLNLRQRITDLELPAGTFSFENNQESPSFSDSYYLSGESISLRLPIRSIPNMSVETGSLSLSTFSMNYRTASVYSESESTVYVESGRSLRLGPDGSVLFSATGTVGIPVGGEGSLTDCIYAAGELVRNTAGSNCGEAEVSLTDIDFNGKESYTFTFGYSINGIPVKLMNSRECAVVSVIGGNIVRAELTLHYYSLHNQSLSPLPEAQAAVLASHKDGNPLLVYEDSADNISLAWILNE